MAVDEIKQLTDEILSRAEIIEDHARALKNADDWRMALGHIHAAERRLWLLERQMLDAAMTLARRREAL